MVDSSPARSCACRHAIRIATTSDIDALLPLIHAHAAYEGGRATIDAQALHRALSGPPRSLAIWLGEAGGQAVAYASATQDYSTWRGREFLHLDCLFVQAEWRGHGIGARLLAEVRAAAVTAGIDEIQWQTPEWNDGACRFYERLGAAAVPKRRFTLRA